VTAESVIYPTPIEVRPATDPAGRPGVLIQFEHGWIVLQPHAAHALANLIIEVADEVTERVGG
jgi:hypothetical protein